MPKKRTGLEVGFFSYVRNMAARLYLPIGREHQQPRSFAGAFSCALTYRVFEQLL